jgi:hypothetical protein
MKPSTVGVTAKPQNVKPSQPTSADLATQQRGAVSIFLAASPEPDKQGLGAVFPRITHKSGGREIAIQLFTERLLVSRSITKGDQLTLRFLGSLLLVEFFVRWNTSREIAAMGDALIKHLGGPWSFRANWSFLTVELARNDLTGGLEKTGIFASAKAPKTPQSWFSLQCDGLPTESTLWQWNSALERPNRKRGSGSPATPTATPNAEDSGQESPQKQS